MAKCALPEEADTEPDTGHCEINTFIHIYVSLCVYIYMCMQIHLYICLLMLLLLLQFKN